MRAFLSLGLTRTKYGADRVYVDEIFWLEILASQGDAEFIFQEDY
jgi:hypothetical protein